LEELINEYGLENFIEETIEYYQKNSIE